MAHFRTGIATISRSLKIVKADQSFYHFIGWENPIYLEQSVCREDFPKLKESLEAAFDTGEPALSAYRVQRPDKSLHWVVAGISGRRQDTGEMLLNLNIQSVEDLEQELRGMSDEIDELDAYMDIMNQIFFRYDVKKDDFCIFTGGKSQHLKLFRGSLQKWKADMLAKHNFSSKFLETFNGFCENLCQAAHHFSHEIMMPNLIRSDDVELYQLKGRTITDSHGNPLVLGCVYAMTKNSRRKKIGLGAETGRDEMTGLLSKRAITDYIKNIIDSGAEGNYYLCVLDIDNFKYINDNFGHMFGDEVIVTVADILKDAIGERGVAGRIGGDEMMLFLENIENRADLKSILRTIRTNVEWAYQDVRKDLHLSCSMGTAAWPADADNYNDLFKIADKMLYLAKEKGKNRYVIYIPDIHSDLIKENKPAAASGGSKGAGHVDKEQLLLEMIENFLHHRIWKIQFVLEQTVAAFHLAQADIYFDEPVFIDAHCRADGGAVTLQRLNCTESVKFRQLFNDNNLAVIDHTADLEFSCPEAYNSLSEQHITAALIYRMEGKIPGYVTFFREDSSSRLWAASDKIYLNLIGKMIELVIYGRQ